MEIKIVILFVFFGIFRFNLTKIYSQNYSEADIKILAEKVNSQIKGVDIGGDIRAKGCLAIGRILVYQYEVPEYWEAYK